MKPGSALLALLTLPLLAATGLFAREFTVLVYNVENLFDVDGIALYGDYKQEGSGNPQPYTPRKLLTKVQNISRILAMFNDGQGPEIVLLQEIEYDRTPDSSMGNRECFLRKYSTTMVETMLTSGFNRSIAGLPAEAFLLKQLEDSGLSGYRVIKPASGDPETKPAQNNVILTRFPVNYVRQHPTEQARDILEVGVDIDGHELILFDNHWKSGASSAETEPIRVQNAGVLRSRLDKILAENPSADIILGGDFNSYYDQRKNLRHAPVTAVNDVLRSRGSESALIEDDTIDLYNLWYELPFEKRGSEVWRGVWGTLMQVMLTRGLYDSNGIQYIDNSFFTFNRPGVNTDTAFGLPRRWFFFGETGGGYSDHLPIGARFRTVETGDSRQFIRLAHPGEEKGADPAGRLVKYDTLKESAALKTALLSRAADEELGNLMGEVFWVDTKLTNNDPLSVRIGNRTLVVHSFDRKLLDSLKTRSAGDRICFYGDLSEYRGQLQFIIRDPSWLKK